MQILEGTGTLTRAASRLLGTHRSHAGSSSGKVADIMELISVDTVVSFSEAYRGVLGDDNPSCVKTSAKALGEAENLAEKYPRDPSVARRVILLRADAGKYPLAFTIARHHAVRLLAGYDRNSPGQKRELVVWRSLFLADKISAVQAADLRARVRELPALRWYRFLAMRQIDLRSGNAAQAAVDRRFAEQDAMAACARLAVLSIFMMLAGLLGIGLLISLGVRKSLVDRDAVPTDSVFDRIAVPLPDRITPSERRLGAGDLLDAFSWYIVAFYVLSFGVEIGLVKLTAHGPRPEWLGVVDVVVSQGGLVIAAFAAVFAMARRNGASLKREIGLLPGVNVKNAIFGVLGWCMALPLVTATGLVAQIVFKNTPDPSNPAIELLAGATAPVARCALFLIVCVVAPVLEETMFRGLFYQAARARLGVWPAILLTGLLFGAIHPVGIASIFPLMMLGCVLAWLAETRKSLWPGMVAHATQNATAFLAVYALYQ